MLLLLLCDQVPVFLSKQPCWSTEEEEKNKHIEMQLVDVPVH